VQLDKAADQGQADAEAAPRVGNGPVGLGPFVWPEAWQPAYPEPEFWWLYGRPQ
jgi:hypothetical protein